MSSHSEESLLPAYNESLNRISEDNSVDPQPMQILSSSSNWLQNLKNNWWPLAQSLEQEEEQHSTCDSSEQNNSSSVSDRARKLDIQTLLSHEGFIDFFRANASILYSIWIQLKFNFTLLIGWLLNTLWYSLIIFGQVKKILITLLGPQVKQSTIFFSLPYSSLRLFSICWWHLMTEAVTSLSSGFYLSCPK